MSKITAKPKITERKVRILNKTVDGDFDFISYKMGGYKKRRVEDGWEYYYINRWEFVRDKVVEEEIVEEVGGYLDLSNREIETLDEIIHWFSNNELDQIKKMNLSNNKIANLNDLWRFRNLMELDLSSNYISEIKTPEDFSFIDNIIVLDNPISKIADLPKNYTRDKIVTCDLCGTTISYKYIDEDGKSLCESCLGEYTEELKERIPHSQAYLDALYGSPKRGCLGILLVIISLGVSILFI
jgi:hypothetical protein